jgi:hypothetical protein
MKASKPVLISLLLTAIITFCFGDANAGTVTWPNSKGEVCLENTTTGGFSRLAVVRIIGSHYTVNGIVTDNDGDKTLVNGNAEVEGNQILINISASGYKAADGEVHGVIGSAQLDAGTLTGIFNGIGFHCDPIDYPDCAFENEGAQNLEIVTCP